MNEAPQSLSNPEVLTPAEKKLRAEMLRIQNDPTLTTRARIAQIQELSGPLVGEMALQDLHRRDPASQS
jgi:hypothetical protein